MKRILSMVCIFSLQFALTACGSQSNGTDNADSTTGSSVPQTDKAQADSSVPSSEEEGDEQADAEPESDIKVLVAYFSATGTTKTLAEYAADAMAADLYEIIPEEPYTDEDLDYGNDRSRSSLEMNDPDARTSISGSVENMEQYDIVFIGYPIWWGQAPRIVSTFFERYDFSGKTIVPLDRPLFDKLNPAPVGAGFFPRAGIIYMDFPGLSRKIRQISSTYRSLALIIAVGPRRSSRRMFPPPYSIWTWPWTRQRGLYLSKNGTRHSNPRWA